MSDSKPEASVCASCRQPKAQHVCGLCGDAQCRSCVVFLDESTFSFRTKLPAELKHTYYCAPCHQAQVEPELEAYHETLERAREVFFFFITQRKPVPIIRKAVSEVRVLECEDRDETILRLGFMAAEQGYNAILQAEVESEKLRNHGWQKTRWKGRGIPALVDAEKIDRTFR